MPKYLEYLISTKDFITETYAVVSGLITNYYDELDIEESDVQVKIFYALLVWLFISLVLIVITWKAFGDKVVRMLTPNGECLFII